MRVITVGLSGPSCSGKTTITRVLQRLTKRSITIYQDDYFKPDTEIPIDPKTQLANWDCPEALNFDGLADTIRYVQQHGALPPNYHSNEVSNTHDGSSLVAQEQLAQWQQHVSHYDEDDVMWLLVDGFMLLSDLRIYDLLDHRLFVTASYATLKRRREERQGYHTLEGYWIDPPGYFDAIVWPEFLRAHQHLPGPHQQYLTHQQEEEKEKDVASLNVTLIDTDVLTIPESVDKAVKTLWP